MEYKLFNGNRYFFSTVIKKNIMNTKTILILFFISIIFLVGLDLQYSRIRLVGNTYVSDSTTSITSFNKGIVVNGALTTNDADIVVPNLYALRLGDPAFQGVYISGSLTTIFYKAASHTFETDYSNSLATLDSVAGLTLQRRQSLHKGASSIVAASKITLGNDGNIFTVTGNTNIDTINITNWTSGANIYLYFTGTPTINNQSTGVGRIYCQGSNISVSAGDVYEFILDDTIWRRVK